MSNIIYLDNLNIFLEYIEIVIPKCFATRTFFLQFRYVAKVLVTFVAGFNKLFNRYLSGYVKITLREPEFAHITLMVGYCHNLPYGYL